MLRNIAADIKYCLDRAAKARDQANQTADPVQKAECLRAELGWLRLARSYEFADSLDHHHKRVIDSSSGDRLEDLSAAAESLCSTAKYLSLEVTSGLPIIAIIDDDPDILEALDLMLSSHGYRSESFASAEDFLDTAATSEATCLVVDIQLGGMSGVELGHQLSASGFTFPIIFMTGSRDELHRRQAMDCGCVAFLLKPFPADRLIEAVTSAIGPKRD